MPKHTAEEYDEAIDAAKYLKQRDGAISSKELLIELERRTGKPAGYWHTIELLQVIRADSEKARRKAKKYRLTKEQEREIVKAAEEIAHNQPVPKVTAQDIRVYFRDKFREMKEEDKPAGTAAITRATAEDFNRILKAAGFTQYNTAGYITSIPPARNPADMETTALRILEAAEDPNSGLSEKLKAIRYDRKLRAATPEELQAVILGRFMEGDFTDIGKTEALTIRKARRNARRYGRAEPDNISALSSIASPETVATVTKAKESRQAAYRDLKEARKANGKKPQAMETILNYINTPDDETETGEIIQVIDTRRDPEE